ncbi:MAG TPA: thymidine kinase [Bacteroidales bacterium]|jgi:thymidine kinase|nr:thymidine kinase [Bacteroidota bacterium]HJN05420.1 thymidine kinase [Bacteroidales bacterium]|tara:strand:+ start:20 stop:601 length:582 start_codon:yes stop_codon:yes gene_type:complete
MFLEKDKNYSVKSGWIEVVCGSMFSGKTEELIRRLNRARIAKQKVEIFKPTVDTRYDEEQVVSHDSNSVSSTPVENATQILFYAEDFEVVGIDEAQFFGNELVNVCIELAAKGKRVIVAGLDMDYLGNPFGPIPNLMATAEYITKVHAICMRCGNLANYSHRIIKNDKLVVLGENDAYEPLCRSCFQEALKEK